MQRALPSDCDTDAGFADRDLFRARAIDDALVIRFRRPQARRANVNVLGERPTIERDQNMSGFDMVAIRNVDHLHDAAARDAERHRARLRLRLRAGSPCRKGKQKHDWDTEAVSYHFEPPATKIRSGTTRVEDHRSLSARSNDKLVR